jgi:anti-sigma B factor antagonist
MEITSTATDLATILVLSGRLDGRNPGILAETLGKELQTRNRIILDLSSVSYIDSTGLGVLVSALKEAIRKEGDIRLINPSDQVRMLLEMTRVDTVFSTYADQKAALNSYVDNRTELLAAGD